MVKHTQTIRRQQPQIDSNCLSLFDHFVALGLKGLIRYHIAIVLDSIYSNFLHIDI